MNATEACIALNMLPTVGPVRLRKLLEVFNEPQQILAAKRSELRKVEGIGHDVADQIVQWEKIVDLTAELERIRQFGANVITTDSSDWATNCPEYKVTAVQATRVSQPSEWQKRFRDFSETQESLLRAAEVSVAK